MPSWLPTALRIAPWAIAALCLAFGLVERGNASAARADLANYQAAAAKAVAGRVIADQKKSAELLAAQAEKLTALHAEALSNVQKALNAPRTDTCGPSVRDAARSVRDALRRSGQ